MTDETRNPEADSQAAATDSEKERTDMPIDTATAPVMTNTVADGGKATPSSPAPGIDALGAMDALNSLHELNSDRDRMAKRSERGMRAMCVRASWIYGLMAFVYWGVGLMFGGYFYSDIGYITIMAALALLMIAAFVVIIRYQKATGISAFTLAPNKRKAAHDTQFIVASISTTVAQIVLPWIGFAWGFIGGNWIGAVVLAVLTALAIYGLERWHIREWTRVSRLPVVPEEDPHA
ncbi:hypothetical protein [Bifidobacterium vansinderenii]|uniref:Uncharacterized protein n=1 Tax=Bifidobacterium vansinderenii TaxID=1984871 RepID=A0A229VY14_9BIFI|nr:hypothetical protein [Bifidobacterium vansinderenii]OXN00497.1 hypothetical protein Tam10B_1367 [Bifidobacterium vansinderenii]